jgi:hypothetical protein
MLPEIRPSISPISASMRVSFSGLPQNSFIATSAATTEQALEPSPNQSACFFQRHRHRNRFADLLAKASQHW